MVDFQQLETYLSVSAATIYTESCDKLLANLEEVLWSVDLFTLTSCQLVFICSYQFHMLQSRQVDRIKSILNQEYYFDGCATKNSQHKLTK